MLSWHPYSTRPYQHVLAPVLTYLMIAQAQYNEPTLAGNYNVGPDDSDCWDTGSLVTLFCDKWNKVNGTDIKWKNIHDGGPHEANFLKLDCSKIKSVFGWSPRWNVETAMDKIVEWTKVYLEGKNITDFTERQIKEFLD